MMSRSKLYRRLSFNLLMLSSLAASGCRPAVAPTELHGHFENSDDFQLEQYRGDQRVVPEYAPSSSVIVSYKLLLEHHMEAMFESLLDAGIDSLWVTVPLDYRYDEEESDFNALFERIGDKKSRVKILRQQAPGKVREWTRDSAPWSARAENGSLRLLDFNYYPDRPSDDSIPTAAASQVGQNRISLPIYIEGGNFMSNSSGVCMMTDKVLDANSLKKVPSDRILNETEITQIFEDYVGCSEVFILPSMPFEGTRHIDMWAKFVDDRRILLSEISDATLSLKVYSAENLAKVKKIKNFLDARAQELKSKGFEVTRLPMPAPSFATDGYGLFRSYTNSLLLNGKLFVPRYERPSNPLDGVNGEYIDQVLIASYEEEVETTHEDLGFPMEWINADSLIVKGGAIHCTTMQLAR